MLKIHEAVSETGEQLPVFLHADNGVISIRVGTDTRALPERAVEIVMATFGAPFDPEERVIEVDCLDLGEGCSIRHVRHLSRYDVIARDYLVYDRVGVESTCALAVTIAGALAYLANSLVDAALHPS